MGDLASSRPQLAIYRQGGNGVESMDDIVGEERVQSAHAQELRQCEGDGISDGDREDDSCHEDERKEDADGERMNMDCAEIVSAAPTVKRIEIVGNFFNKQAKAIIIFQGRT